MSLSKSLLWLPAIMLGASTTAFCQSQLVYMQEVAAQKHVMLAGIDGSNPTQMPSDEAWALYPDISTDGRYIAYSGGQDETKLGIMIYDSKRKVTEQWTAQNGLYLHADLSGDGRFLAFSGPLGENGKQAVAVINLAKERAKGPSLVEGGREIYQPQLTVVKHTMPIYFPTLSSDGEFVIYQTSQGNTKYLVQHNLLSNKNTDLTAVDGYAMSPALSFDDNKIAYTLRDKDGRWELYLQDLHTNKVEKLTNTEYQDFSPTFKPDGGLIYAANPAENFQLYEISKTELDAGTYQAKPLPPQDGDLYSPSVSGDVKYTQTILQQIPEPGRSSFGAIAHQGKIFVVGGHVGPEHTYPQESFSNRVDIYNEATKTWSQGAPLSLARHGFSLAAYNGYVYAFGGFTYSTEHKPSWKSVDIIERYSIKDNKWEIVGHLAKPRSSNVVAQVGTKVYLVGGWDSTPQKENDTEGRFHDTIEMFDLSTEQVTTLDVKLQPPLRRALSSIVRGDEVILVGGLGVGSNHFDLLDQVTAFNTKTLTWHEYPKLPFPTFAPAAGMLGDELYVFGGMFKTGEMDFVYVNHVYSVNLDKDKTWHHTGRHLVESKGFSQVVDMESLGLGILGGHTYVGDEDHPVPTFEAWSRK